MTRENVTDVQNVLDRMARAVTTGDGKTMAQIWETPAMIVADQSVMVVTSPREIEQFFGGAKEQYNARGITDTRGEIVRLERPTERIAIVEVRWPYLDATGATRGEETSTYTLRRDEHGEMRLRAAVMHGARNDERSQS